MHNKPCFFRCMSWCKRGGGGELGLDPFPTTKWLNFITKSHSKFIENRPRTPTIPKTPYHPLLGIFFWIHPIIFFNWNHWMYFFSDIHVNHRNTCVISAGLLLPLWKKNWWRIWELYFFLLVKNDVYMSKWYDVCYYYANTLI